MTPQRRWYRWAVEEGDRLPPWPYLLGRMDFVWGCRYFYPVPLALWVRAADRVRFLWNRLRSRPSAVDALIIAACKKARADGFEAGLRVGEHTAFQKLDAAIAQHAQRSRERSREPLP